MAELRQEKDRVTKHPVLQEILGVVREILQRHGLQPAQIYLFGSRARGAAGEDNDWDLMILVEEELTLKARRKLIVEIKRVLARLGIPNDVLIQSTRSFRTYRRYPGHLDYEIYKEGVPLL